MKMQIVKDVWEDPNLKLAITLFIGVVIGLFLSLGLTRETLTLFAAILAACVGFFAYSWQKTVDRREAILTECRKVYREYLIAAEQLLQTHCSDAEDSVKDQQTAEYRKAFLALSIYGTDEIVEEAKPYLLEVVRFTDATFVEPKPDKEVILIRAKLEALCSQMRDDCNDAKVRN